MISKLKNVAAIGLLVLISGCGGDDREPGTEDNGKDRKVILTHWVDNIIVPSYANFKVELDAMVTKGNSFIGSPNTTTLAEFRTAWIDAYKEWQMIEVFEFGPAERHTLRNFMNIYPADVTGIGSNINDASANLEVPAAYPRQGFPALDYLINGVGVDDGAIVAYYTGAEGVKRLAYLNRILMRMTTLTSNVISEWTSYRDTFISRTGLDIGSSMGSVVNAYILYYERFVRSGKVGIPSGATIASAGVPHPETVEAYYKKDISLDLLKTAHQSAVSFFKGTNRLTGEDGPSFDSYLDALDAKDATSGKLLSEIIGERFDDVEASFSNLSNDFRQQIQNNNQAMIDTYTTMQKLIPVLKVDMTSAMSVTITYTDNDGD